jgi:hypothetical protein
MKYIGTLTSDARGKLGGVVFTRGRNGTNMKAHAVGLNAASPYRAAQRNSFAFGVPAWQALSFSNQTTWAALAASYTYINSLAQAYSPTGMQLWMQAYSNAARFSTVPPSSAPMSKPSILPIDDVEVLSLAGVLTVTGYSGGIPSPQAFSYSISRVLSPSINYVKGIGRRQMGTTASGNPSTCTQEYIDAYGAIPNSGDDVAIRFVPCDPTSFISGTPSLINAEVS